MPLSQYSFSVRRQHVHDEEKDPITVVKSDQQSFREVKHGLPSRSEWESHLKVTRVEAKSERINEHGCEQAPGDGEGQRSLACCSPWGHKESDTTEQQQHNREFQPDARFFYF